MTDDSEGYDGNLSGMKFAHTCMQTLQRHEFTLFRDTGAHTQAHTLDAEGYNQCLFWAEV